MIGFQPGRTISWAMGVSIGLLAFFVFLAGVSILHDNDTVYPRDDNGLYAYHDDQCERPVDQGWMVEVQNTISNAGYVVVGVLILMRAGSWAGLLFGLNLVILGAMSALYHATLGREVPQTVDVAWVYAALFSLQVYIASVHLQAREPWRLSGAWPAIIGLALMGVGVLAFLLFQFSGVGAFFAFTALVFAFTALCFLIRKVMAEVEWLGWVFVAVTAVGIGVLGVLIKTETGWSSTTLFVIIVGLLIVQLLVLFAGEKTPKGLGGQLAWIGGLLFVGAVFRLFDGYEDNAPGPAIDATRKLLCNPDLVVQPHALWHLIGAAALLLAYDLVTQFQATGQTSVDKPLIFPDAADPKS
ncbi:hypothetical protein ASC89_20535 [Devosia sp. Root413D1]|jgi:hypothetical protein|uniref:hypothetical protein n=1 Tax=unclassified Devosia TaxID=196773 RepID=UPI000701BA8E|nr:MULTISPECIES: hypothetical protein [unclassified Devosia]KQU97662.1 hypothetical protein ASC68_12825 [Devosia sp. Root105]KQW77558.1 hypothetical protein ASC89_20535 [Devosia sp. Root413D1]